MTWGASGIVKHPRTGAIVTSLPTVRAFRTDTWALHGTTPAADASGVVVFTDLVDDVNYVAYADIGLPTWAVVPLTYQFQSRAVPDEGLNSMKLGVGTTVTPSFGVPQVRSGVPNASTRFLYAQSLDSAALKNLVRVPFAICRVEGIYLTSAGASGTIDVSPASGSDIALVSASGSVWNLFHSAAQSEFSLKRVSGSGTVHVALQFMVIAL